MGIESRLRRLEARNVPPDPRAERLEIARFNRDLVTLYGQPGDDPLDLPTDPREWHRATEESIRQVYGAA